MSSVAALAETVITERTASPPAGIRIAVNRDGAVAERSRGADHPAGDLAAVGDEDFGEHEATILE